MPQVHLYIRNEDIDKWASIKNKSEFVHNALNPDGKRYGNIVIDESKPIELETNGRPIHKFVGEPTKPKRKTSPEEFQTFFKKGKK